MPAPSSSLTTLRPDLSGSFLEFDLDMARQGFIAQRVFPSIDVAKASGTFGKIPIEQLLKGASTERAPGSGYGRGNYRFQDVSFACIEHGWEEPVDDNEASLYSNYFDAEQIATMRARGIVMRNAEQRVADAVFDTATWTGAALTTAVGTTWSTLATATPIADVNGAKRKVRDNSGLIANALIIDWDVFTNLQNVAEIVDRIKHSGLQDPNAAAVTAQALARAFDLDEVIVARPIKDTAAEGQAASLSTIWDKTMAMVCRVARTNDIREPCIGRVFHWNEDGSTPLGTVESYRDEPIRGDVVRVRHQVDELVLYVEAGHLLTAVG